MPDVALEDLQPDATVRGILPDAAVTVVSVQWHGSDALTLVYRGPDGRVASESSTGTTSRAWISSGRAAHGASTVTAASTAWCLRCTGSGSPSSSTPCWRCT